MKEVELTTVKERVANKLVSSKDFQESDSKLIAEIWYEDMIKVNVPKDLARKIADLVKSSKLSNTESIRRCRQMFQEKYPELYGKNHIRRKKESVIKEEVNAIIPRHSPNCKLNDRQYSKKERDIFSESMCDCGAYKEKKNLGLV